MTVCRYVMASEARRCSGAEPACSSQAGPRRSEERRENDMSTKRGGSAPSIEHIAVSAYTVPTDLPESDGTLEWDKTTMVVVEATAGGQRGLGYTYADLATARLIEDRLAHVVQGRDAMAVPAAWAAMVREIRNLGRPGIVSMAIAAVDAALWDLKARLLALPLVTLLGAVRDSVPVYGSGGFTSYSLAQLEA